LQGASVYRKTFAEFAGQMAELAKARD
jgi:hypothetical protein